MSPGRETPSGLTTQPGLPFSFELAVFLVAVAMLLASLVVLYLYLNRRLCFGTHDKRKYSDYSSNALADDTLCYYEDLSASSDSDEHLLNDNERSASVCSLDDRRETHPFTELNANLNYNSCSQTQTTNAIGASAAIAATALTSTLDASAIAPASGQQEVPFAARDGGFLEVIVNHDALARRVIVSLVQARKLPMKTQGGASSYRVKVTAITSKQAANNKMMKHSSKVKQANQQGNCIFNEDLVFSRISTDTLGSVTLRFRIYSAQERLTRRQRLISEATMALSQAHLRETLTLAFEARTPVTNGSDSEQSDSSTGSLNSLQHVGLSASPELLVGLAYNGTTGRLSVEVIGGSHLGVLPGIPHVKSCPNPDTFVKLSLLSSAGREIASSKTSVRRGQADPVYKETFVFQVALFQLTDVTLILSAYKRNSMKRKQLIGWVSFGLNASSDTQLVHWSDMRDGRGEQIARWNTLIQTPA